MLTLGVMFETQARFLKRQTIVKMICLRLIFEL